MTLLTALERLSEFAELREGFYAEPVVGFLRQGAESRDPHVRAVVAKLLGRLVKEGGEAGVARLAAHGLLEASEALLLDDDTGTAEAAAAIVRDVMRYEAWREHALAAVDRLRAGLRGMGDVQSIRVLHLFVEIGKGCDEAFKAMEARGAYRQVLDTFSTEDILLKMNAVELMDALASFPAGQDYIGRECVPEQLVQNLTDPMCDDSVRMCIVRLLGLVLRRSPETMPRLLPERGAPLAQHMAGMLESSGTDTTARLTALNAWANISANDPGLMFFLQWEGRLNAILSHVSSPNNEVCKGALAAWAVVLEDRPPLVPGQSAGGAGLAARAALWEVAERRLLPAVLRNLTAKPFADVRFHCWHVLALLARSRSVAQAALPSTEMQELLLDFGSETESAARIAKHAFVQALCQYNGEWLVGFLSEQVTEMLTEYAKQSPHWAPRVERATVTAA